MKWIKVTKKLPPENETVWGYNPEKNLVMLCCRVYPGNVYNGWLWAESNGSIYVENNKIVAECECDDDYDITHWMPLPKLPKK